MGIDYRSRFHAVEVGSLELEMRYVLQDGSTAVAFNSGIQRIMNVTITERHFHVENVIYCRYNVKLMCCESQSRNQSDVNADLPL